MASSTIILEMLQDRKYQNITVESELEIYADGVYVSFSQEDSVSVDTIKRFISKLIEKKINHGIFVYPGTITSSAKKAVSVVDNYIELFHLDTLKFNPTRHRLVPRHQLVDEKTAQVIKKKYGKDLPRLLTTDAISRYYDFREGSIIEITRTNGIVAYRLVVQ